jgi:transketolase
LVSEALKASDTLDKEGISAEVINIHTLKPIDIDGIVNSVKKTGAAVTCEEHNVIGGLGSAVCEVLGENYPVPIKRVGVMDTFGESGKPSELLKEYGLLAEDIVVAVREVVKKK